MPNRITKLWLPCIGMALWPVVALANAGTPLMWARGIHLFVGNLAIGIGEGCLLAILFKKRVAPCIGVMIVANYFSAWVGMLLLMPKLSDSLGLDLNNVWRWLWIMVTKSDTGSGQWGLVARLATSQEDPLLKTVLHNIATVAPSPTKRGGYEEWANIGEVPRLDAAGKNNWKFRAGF